jgi:hypothetical protein
MTRQRSWLPQPQGPITNVGAEGGPLRDSAPFCEHKPDAVAERDERADAIAYIEGMLAAAGAHLEDDTTTRDPIDPRVDDAIDTLIEAVRALVTLIKDKTI